MARIFRPKEASPNRDLYKLLETNETVRPVRDTKHYYITSYGRVFSGKKAIEYTTIEGDRLFCIVWKELRPRLCRGYFVVDIEGKKQYIHKLVFEAYNDYIDNDVVKIIHKDKDKLNNNINNLQLAWRNKTSKDKHYTYGYQMMMKGKIGLLQDYKGVKIDYTRD